MSAQALAQAVIAESTQNQEADSAPVDEQPPEKEISPPESPLKPERIETPDEVAGKILSAPPKPPTPTKKQTVTKALKTRKDLQTQIRRVCESRGEDPKQYNLGRRRKMSLENILKSQLAEAAEAEVCGIPEEAAEHVRGLSGNMKFAVSMAFRMDLTFCKIAESLIGATDSYHGMSIQGFSETIETSPTMQSEIKECWEEILSDPANSHLLEYCSPTARLLLIHVYSIAAVLRSKETRRHVEAKPPPQRPKIVPRPRPEPVRPVAPRRSSGKLQRLARSKQARGENNAVQGPLDAPRGLARTV